MPAAFLGVAVGAAGCGQIIGADQYAARAVGSGGAAAEDAPGGNGGSDDAGASDDAGVSWGDLPGWIVRGDCQGCLTEHCGPERAACDADDVCRTSIGCLEQCKDPQCIARCRPPDAALTPEDRPDLNVDALFLCGGTHCAESCPVDPLECLGQWEPALLESPDVRIEMQMVGVIDRTVQRVGLTARACRAGAVPCLPVASAVSGEGGFLDLTIDTRPAGTGTRSVGFDGYFEFEHADLSSPYVWAPNMAMPSRHLFSFGTLDQQLALAFTDSIGVAVDETKGVLWVRPFGCDGALFSLIGGLVIRVEPPGETDDVWYTINGVPSREATHTSSQDPRAFVFNVAEGRKVVTAHDESTNRLIARGEVFALPGAVHTVWLFPPTRGEAESLNLDVGSPP